MSHAKRHCDNCGSANSVRQYGRRLNVSPPKALAVLFGFPVNLQSAFSKEGVDNIYNVFVCQACLSYNPNFIKFWSELGPGQWPK
jgi:hypothetical protein